MKYLKLLVTILFVLVASVFLSAPAVFMQSFLDGLTVWAINVLPALFPFAVICTLSVKFLPHTKFSFCNALFGVRADGIFVKSILCGYPIGAKSIAECDLIDGDSALRLSSFCSTASPIFIVATVGTKLLQNTTATIILVATHLLSALLNGLVYRKKESLNLQTATTFKAQDFGDTVTSTALSVISVGGLIALFYMLTDIIKSVLPQAISQSIVTMFLLGLFEMTNGIISICATTDTLCATVLCSFLLGFGGLCVFAQCVAYLANKNINCRKLLQIKLTQGSIATLLSFCLCKIFL